MTTKRKVLLVILAGLFVIKIGIYWQSKPIKNQHLPPPTNEVNFSYHDGGYESAWIQDIDKEKGIVLVTTIDSKMTIVFRPTAEDLQKFNVGSVAPVTFQCTKLKKDKCDFSSHYKLFVSNALVEVELLKFPEK